MDYRRTVFGRLAEVPPETIMRLMNDPRVRRHLPLARTHFGSAEYEKFLAEKEGMWKDRGYGPWAFLLDGDFIGWGGLQPKDEDADVGMVLHPDHWGAGRVLCELIVEYAFGKLDLDSVIMLLPPSRTRIAAVRRLGFRPDGETLVEDQRFHRYRLTRSPTPSGSGGRGEDSKGEDQ